MINIEFHYDECIRFMDKIKNPILKNFYLPYSYNRN